MKIRTIIFGVYVAVSGVAFVGLSALVLRDVRLRYIDSMARTLGDTATFLAAFAQPAAERSDDWPRKLAELPANAGLLRVFACDRAGRVLFDSAPGAQPGEGPAWPAAEAEHAPAIAPGGVRVSEVAGELRVVAPVRRQGETVGWVGVGRRLATVSEGVQRARIDLIWILGLIAAGMVAIGWWIATRLTHSVERLTAYAQAVRDGRTAVPPQSRAHEVAELARAFEEMRVALEGKAYVERYTQALAHELKAPLSSIRGAAELLGEDPPEADRARFVANLRAETERLQRIVERLLELAALESKRAGSALGDVDLTELVRARCRAAEAGAALRAVTLRCGARGTAARVQGDAVLLGQAVDNLLQNAIEFSPRGAAVEIAVEGEAGGVEVRVEDRGPGVPDFAVEKVFDRFYSLPRPDTGRKSSGLGLSIVREVVRLHAGEVRLENRPGGGARAVLRLPVARGNSH